LVRNNPFDFPNPFDNNQTEKDTRRAFSQTQKKEILAKQGFKCARCHEKLGVGYHFDHIKPWAEGGKTTVRNGQVLCAQCHEEKSHRGRLDTVDEGRKTKNNNPFFSF
jgi:5-methylcytosine-specific restriction endonuclease McrA